jgi:hypothetical protein
MMRLKTISVSVAVALSVMACGGRTHAPPSTQVQGALRINEVVSDNEGVWVDELGQTDDYVELVNAGTENLSLNGIVLSDADGSYPLPAVELAPGGRLLLWADNEPEQGPLHLPMKVNSGGERLALSNLGGAVIDETLVPPLAEHHAWARQPDMNGVFVDCGWATPGASNGAECGPHQPPGLPEEISFARYVWPEPWPAVSVPLTITELALRPAQFIEVLNTSSSQVVLADYSLSIAPSRVGQPWPVATAGVSLVWPQALLEPGERVAVPVSPVMLGTIASDARFEGVATLRRLSDTVATEQVEFDLWPDGAALARGPAPSSPFQFCQFPTPLDDGSHCQAVGSRPMGDHVRSLYTPGDFEALSKARARVGISGVEFIVDMQSEDRVTLLNSSDWDLHYLFVSEVIDGQPHIDRCTPSGYQQFQQGWYAFSVDQYFQVEGRRYLLGNIVHHAGTDLHTVEFSPGDRISPEQMMRAFFAVMRAVPTPGQWAIRPQDAEQVASARLVEGRVPLVDPNAPYRGITFQPLSAAVAYGTLRFVPADSIATESLGLHDILLTDQVPNDIPFVAGLITEAIQTPLSHVNVLSRARGTPNMFLRDARNEPQFAALLGKLVRLEVRGADYLIAEATAAEAVAFWQSRTPAGPPLAPRLDTSLRGPQDLAARGFADLPSLGGKAAQMAELLKVKVCAATAVPERPFALPVVHSLEHFTASGAAALLAGLEGNADFLANPAARDAGLAKVRQAILQHPVEPSLLDELEAAIASRWPAQRLRFRSSSNTEDLASFSGAGLYESAPWEPGDGRAGLESAIHEVWASLWNTRAYDERAAYNIDQHQVAMGVLVHPAYFHESANGVVISRDVREPMRADRYFFNAQVGEALVTNPAPGVTSDQFTASVYEPANIVSASMSSLPGSHPVLRGGEVTELVCSLQQIHNHFREVIDPEHKNAWFAMDVEFKLVGPERSIAIKQARPYSFGSAAPAGWCDLF